MDELPERPPKPSKGQIQEASQRRKKSILLKKIPPSRPLTKPVNLLKSPIGQGKARRSFTGKAIHFTRDQTVEILSHHDGRLLNEEGETMWFGRVINNGNTETGNFPSCAIQIRKSKTPDYKELLQYATRSETKQNTLYRTVLEFVGTEAKHVEDLALVCMYFIEPFGHVFGSRFARQVFSDWEALTKVHEQFLYRLAQGLPTTADFRKFQNQTWNFKINEYDKTRNEEKLLTLEPHSNLKLIEAVSVIKTHVSFIEDLHRQHFSNFLFLGGVETDLWHEILETMSVLLCQAILEMNEILKICIPCVINQSTGIKKKLSKKHLNFLIKCENESQDELNLLKLDAFLIKPVQRITRYPLLMREIVKHSNGILPKVHDKATLALDKLSFIVDYVNKRMAPSDEFIGSSSDDSSESPRGSMFRSSRRKDKTSDKKISSSNKMKTYFSKVHTSFTKRASSKSEQQVDSEKRSSTGSEKRSSSGSTCSSPLGFDADFLAELKHRFTTLPPTA